MSRAQRLVAGAMAAVVVSGATIAVARAAGVDAQPLSGCLDGSGKLESVAVGTTPLRSCGKGERQVTWGLPGSRGPRGVAGPEGPSGISGAGRVPEEQIVFFDDMEYGADEPTKWTERPQDSWSASSVTDVHLRIEPSGTVRTTVSLPTHNTIRIQADLGYIDRWRGDQAFLLVDDRVIWSGSSSCVVLAVGCAGLNLAMDQQDPDVAGIPLDVTIPHTGPTATLEFSTTGSSFEHSLAKSFVIDNVTVSVGQSPVG